MKPKCTWTYYEDDVQDYWATGCGELFCLNDGTPTDNKMKYCSYCGRLILEMPIPEAEIVDET